MPDSPDITVTERADHSFEVEVGRGARSHRYQVTVPASLAARLGHPTVDSTRLVRESFGFLLEREPASAILSRFSLDVISRYFPEYEAVLGERLGGDESV